MLWCVATPDHALGSATTLLMDALQRAGIVAEFGPYPGMDIEVAARDVPVSAEMRAFYGTTGPLCQLDIPAPLGAITFVPGRDLVAHQYGYRWDARDGQRLDAWPAAWVVLADHAGDPFIADTAIPGTPVGIAIHGVGQWTPYWVAPTLADFIALLACFVQAYVVEYHHRGNRDEDHDDPDLMWPPAYHQRIDALLRERAPAVDAAAFTEYLSK
jgi:hypothetical protein